MMRALALVVFASSIIVGAASAVERNPPAACLTGGSNLVWPISGMASHQPTDKIQDVNGPIIRDGAYDNHAGVDFDVNTGTVVRSVADGWIARIGVFCGAADLMQPIPDGYCVNDSDPHDSTGAYPGSGHFVLIRHYITNPEGQGFVWGSRYSHLSDFETGLAEGDCVSAGDPIGSSGNTGVDVDTEHLHLEAVSQPQSAYPDPNQISLRSPYHLLPSVPSASKTLTRLPAPSHHSARLEVTATRSDIERIELSDVAWLGADASDRYPTLYFRNGGVMVLAPNGDFVERCQSSTCMNDDWMIDPADFDHENNDEFAVWTIGVNPSHVRKARLEVRDLQGATTDVLLGLGQLAAIPHPHGRFTSNPAGLNCGSDCSEFLPLGSAV